MTRGFNDVRYSNGVDYIQQEQETLERETRERIEPIIRRFFDRCFRETPDYLAYLLCRIAQKSARIYDDIEPEDLKPVEKVIREFAFWRMRSNN